MRVHFIFPLIFSLILFIYFPLIIRHSVEWGSFLLSFNLHAFSVLSTKIAFHWIFGILYSIIIHFKTFAIIWIVQSALYSIPWQTCSIKHGLGFSVKHPATLQLMLEDCSYRNIQLSEVEQFRVKKCRRFYTAAHDLNPGSLNRESKAQTFLLLQHRRPGCDLLN